MEAVLVKRGEAGWSTLADWLFIPISPKMKFAIKAALSITIVYLVALWQGWNHPSTSAITIMLIAAVGTLGDSVSMGAMRVVGTLIGAAIGLTLIGLFPQERMSYLLAVSLLVTLFLYLARAYRGDTTVLFISGLTIMLIFQDANAENAFLYGIERTYMTVFGIVIFTLVGLFLWPVDMREQGREAAADLSGLQAEFYRESVQDDGEYTAISRKLFDAEQRLRSLIGSASEMNLSLEQWRAFIYDYRKVDELLVMLARFTREHEVTDPASYVEGYERLEQEIVTMLDALTPAWMEQKQITIPEPFELRMDTRRLDALPIMQSATLVTLFKEQQRLHERLRRLATKLNSLNSPMPTSFEIEAMPKEGLFRWFDSEDLKASLVTFLVFWGSVAFWIWFNPPGGFYIVTLATSLSMMTAFQPLKPSLLIILFSISFVFATAAYVGILPYLHYGWELGLFIFIYSFIGFYLINPQISIFFLLGLSTFNITNEMQYSFALFMMILMIFYLFLFILLFFYYIPFSTRPQDLFETLRRRFFALSSILLRESDKGGFWQRWSRRYAAKHLMNTVRKMALWAGKVDTALFPQIDAERLQAFVAACEEMAYILLMMSRREANAKARSLTAHFREQYGKGVMVRLTEAYAKGRYPDEINEEERDLKRQAKRVEEHLAAFATQIEKEARGESETVVFLEAVSLRKSVALAFSRCQSEMERLPLRTLRESRF